MPELPEVETVRRGLENNIIDKKIASVFISDKKLRLPFPKNFSTDLKNKTIISVKRRARYIIIELDKELNILVHLGMTGKIIYQTKTPTPSLHDHCLISFSDKTSIIYNDPRRFGLIDLVKTSEIKNHKMLKNLGPEPLSKEFNAKYLQSKLENKQMNIKTAMMDNEIVVGVGNIYINESLFQSSISPLKAAGNLKLNQLENLIINIKKILKKAIELGGSTLRDYVNLHGDVGGFQFNFAVYGRTGQKCIVCDGIIKKIKQNGRSSFYCQKCQQH